MHPAPSTLLSPTVATWEEFATAAPRIAEIFVRRHAAAGGLCMLATLRPDGFPRISPMEPRIFEGTLWIGSVGLFQLRARDVMGYTFVVFVVLLPTVLLLVTVLGRTLSYPL